MALPVNVTELVRSGTKLLKEREREVRLMILVEFDAADALIDAVREELRPRTANVTLSIDVVEPGVTKTLPVGMDAVIVVVGGADAGIRPVLTNARLARVPVVVVSLGTILHGNELADALLHPVEDIVVREEPAEVVERLGAWLADKISGKKLALAHNFLFMRHAVAEDAVHDTAWQNALIGAVSIIPGADMPIMTANQGKMLLQIAAAYGQPLGSERIKELAAVVGGGFLLRALARQALVAVPLFGWAVKGGVAYTGTIAMGRAAIGYFEQGADLSQVTMKLKELRDAAVQRLPRSSRLAPPRPDIPALPETFEQ